MLLARVKEVGATVAREGVEFGVVSRVPAVGGQVMTLRGLRQTYDEVFLPLYGAHQAQNAAVALAAVEAFAGDQPLDDALVREAFASVTSPGRLEVIRRSPTIVLDAAHNPHGAQAVAAALDDSFQFSPLIGVVGVMADKDDEGVLAAFEPHFAHVICTQNSTARARPAEQLAETAIEIYGEDRVTVVPRLADAIDQAAALAEAGDAFGDPLGSGAVLITGSVVTVGEARSLLTRPLVSGAATAFPAPRHVRRGAGARGDHPRAHDAGDDHHRRRAAERRAAGRARADGGLPASSPACCAVSGATCSAG